MKRLIPVLPLFVAMTVIAMVAPARAAVHR